MALDNNGGQIPGGDNQPGAGGGNIPAGQQDATGGGQQPVAGQQGAGQQVKKYEYTEDRSDWVPRTRLNENNPKFTQRLTQAEAAAARYQQELETERQRTRALAGLDPALTDEQKNEAEAKKLLLKWFPHLETLKDIKPEQLTQALSAGRAAEEAEIRSWERHSTSMLTKLESEVAKAIGVDKLSPRQQSQLRRAYTDEAQSAVNARFVNYNGQWVLKEGHDSSNDFMSRHDRGDDTLIKEFAKEYVGDWFEPARRQVTSQVARRGSRPVPNGARSGQVTSKAPEINYNNEADFKKALIEARRGASE